MRLRSYLLTLILGILLPVLVFSAVMLVLFHRQTRAATEKGLLETVRALSVAVDRELSASISVLQALATADPLRTGDLTAFHGIATAVLVSQPAWEGIVLYDPSGQQLINTTHPLGDPLPMTADTDALARVVRTRAPVVSNLVTGRGFGRRVLGVVVPVLSDNRLRYVLRAVFRPQIVNDLLSRRQVPPGYIGGLIDGNHIIIARTRSPERFVGQPVTADFRGKLDTVREGVFRTVTMEGEGIYSAVSRSQVSGWTVALGVPVSVVEAPLKASLWWLAGIDALCVVTALLVGVPVARRVRRSIQGLSDAATSFVRGERVDVPRSQVREIDEVAQVIELASRERKRGDATAAALAAVGRELTTTLDLGQVTSRIVSAVRQVFIVRRVNLYTAEPVSGGLLCVATAGSGDQGEWVGRTVPPGMGTSGRALAERRMISSPDVIGDASVAVPDWIRDRMHDDRYRAVTSVPLIARDEVLGVLSLGYETGRDVTDDEARSVALFADQAAIAIQNGQIFEHERVARKAAESAEGRARTLARLNQVVSSSLDMEEVLRQIARAAAELMAVQFASFWVAVEGEEMLELRARSSAAADDFPFTTAKYTEGVLGWVASHRRSVNVADVFSDGRFLALDWWRAHGLRSFVAIPITHDGALLAVLALNGQEPFQFTEEDERLLEAFVHQAAVAIQNARSVLELRNYQARLETLLQVSREISRIQPTTALLASLAQACGQLLDTDAVGFRVVEGDELVIAAIYGPADQVMTAPRLAMGEGLSGLVARTGELLAVSNPAQDPRSLEVDREAVQRLGYRAWLGVPIKVGERMVGVLNTWTRRAEGFSPQDEALLTAFASQAAVVLENARLYQEIERSYQELTQTQAQLTQAQKMEAIGQLAGGIAHDFNNLLTVIAGRSAFVLQREGIEEATQRDVELISKTADRAAGLTRQLLAFSRKQVLQPKPLDLNTLVAGIVPMLRRLIGEDVELVTVAGDGLGPVMADAGQLEQVIMNLAVNARDAMPEGGMLRIETAVRDVEQATRHARGQVPPGEYVALIVQDAGGGMDAATLARIFEPFFTTKEVGKGTGLGLATVHGIVHQSGGHVAVDTTLGSGTTFTVYLPRIDAASETVEAPLERPSVVRGQETVLLVEDDVQVRRLAAEFLTGCGYTVLETGDPLWALVVADRHQGEIHLLVTDIVMPAMRGPEMAGHVVTSRPATRVLYISGYPGEIPDGSIEPAGAYLQKPFTPGDLARKVRETLDSGGRQG
jgi:two-component system cell cycle sensor histidine kinase/response regulator CckA